MTHRLEAKFIVLVLVVSFAGVVAHADTLYTVTVTPGTFIATQFSFTETSIFASGDVTSLTNISGASVKEFAWDSAASGSCTVNGITVTFGGDACAGWAYSTFPVTSWAGFAPGSFLAFGSYTSLSGDVTVSIVCTDPTPNGACPVTTPTPEPSSLMLLGTGALGLAGLIRKKLVG